MSDHTIDIDDAFRYDKMVERALRGVVLTALEEVNETGLHDDHHFYITFRTDFPKVEIPDYLRERYPGEMTIVLQHQFYDLDIREDGFSVMLKFNNVPERLSIPLAAVTIFTDPSVNFALQFQPLSDDDEDDDAFFDEETDDLEDGEDDDAQGEVISLDQFRAKGKTDKKSKSDDDESSDDDEDADDAKAEKGEKKDKPKAKSKSKSKPKKAKKTSKKDDEDKPDD